MTGIYCIENKTNGQKYIGQARNIEHRWKEHRRTLNAGKHCNIHLQRAWMKDGESAFVFYVLELCDIASLSDRETYYISLYDTYNNGYNMTKGGEGTSGHLHTDEYKEHMRKLFTGRKFSPETLQKMSAAKKGKIPKNTDAVKKGHRIASLKLKGRQRTPEHAQRISEALKGHTAWNKGMHFEKETHPMFGKHHSEETKRKISEAHKNIPISLNAIEKSSKRVRCIETGQEYSSITSASNDYGVSISAISRVLNGKSKTCCNLHWEYIT